MQLNLPVMSQFESCENLLIAGMGGGYDVFCGLPIYFELLSQGKTVHLANYSFTGVAGLQPGGTVRLTDTLVGVTADYERRVMSYFPELYLAKWFKQTQQQEIIIWCFQKTGVKPLMENYRALIDHLSIDGILLIDGGVDSLMRGDENEVGTIAEDFLSLMAVNEMAQVPLRMLACIGLGAEENVTYEQVFQNIADLTAAGAYHGASTLVKQNPAYQRYEEAVLFVQDQPFQSPSVINSSIISAVRGEPGDYHLTLKTHGSTLHISPLMPLYWFFDIAAVAERNLYLDDLAWTETFLQAYNTLLELRQVGARRKPTRNLFSSNFG